MVDNGSTDETLERRWRASEPSMPINRRWKPEPGLSRARNRYAAWPPRGRVSRLDRRRRDRRDPGWLLAYPRRLRGGVEAAPVRGSGAPSAGAARDALGSPWARNTCRAPDGRSRRFAEVAPLSADLLPFGANFAVQRRRTARCTCMTPCSGWPRGGVWAARRLRWRRTILAAGGKRNHGAGLDRQST